MDSDTENSIDLVVPETPEYITKTHSSDYTTASYLARRRSLFSVNSITCDKGMPSPRSLKCELTSLSPTHVSQTPHPGVIDNCLVAVIGESSSSVAVIPSPIEEESCKCSNDPTRKAYWEFIYNYFVPEYGKKRLTLSQWLAFIKCETCSREVK